MTPAETLTTARAVWREIQRDGSDNPRGLALWYARTCNLDAALFMAEIDRLQLLARLPLGAIARAAMIKRKAPAAMAVAFFRDYP